MKEAVMIFFITVVILIVILYSIIYTQEKNNVYLFLFYTKHYLVWKYVMQNIDKFELKLDIPSSKIYIWKSERYSIVLWKDSKVASIHIDSICIFPSLYIYASRKLYQAIKDKESNQ